jgi:hypothetical protein
MRGLPSNAAGPAVQAASASVRQAKTKILEGKQDDRSNFAIAQLMVLARSGGRWPIRSVHWSALRR